jgi:hypothetical protein
MKQFKNSIFVSFVIITMIDLKYVYIENYMNY